MMSNLYILRPKNDDSPPWRPWYDKSFGFVVCADNSSKARKLAATECGDEGKEAWLNATLSSCTELKPTGKNEVIMQDFNAA